MKPFDLEAAKAGKSVQTRNGQKARIICFDSRMRGYPIVALVESSDGTENPKTYTSKGCYMEEGEHLSWDLVMTQLKEKRWVVVRDIEGVIRNGRKVNFASNAFHSKEGAEECCDQNAQIIEIEIDV